MLLYSLLLLKLFQFWSLGALSIGSRVPLTFDTPPLLCVCVCQGAGIFSTSLETFDVSYQMQLRLRMIPPPFHLPQPLATAPLTWETSELLDKLNLGPCPFLPPQSLPCRNNALSPGSICLPVSAPEKLGDHSDVIAFLSVCE